MTVALKGIFGWWEEGMNLKEELKSALAENGELCAVSHPIGDLTMP